MSLRIRSGVVADWPRGGSRAVLLTRGIFFGWLPKRLTLLKEALPTVSRVAALWHPGAYSGRTMTNMMKETEAAAQALGVHLPLVAVQSPDELDRAFSTMAAERADALLVFPSPMLFNEGKRIVDLAAKHQLPSMQVRAVRGGRE